MSVRFEQVSTLPWNIKQSYSVDTKVAYDGKYYISKKNVPVGINIGMSDYWKKMELKDNIEELADDVEDLQEDVEDLQDNVGTLSNLTTTDKSSLVGAINEVDGLVGDLQDNVGTLSNLTTTDKSSLVGAINEVDDLVGDLQEQLVVTVSEVDVPFKFAYDSENEVYGFMVGEVFHPFGGEVIGE